MYWLFLICWGDTAQNSLVLGVGLTAENLSEKVLTKNMINHRRVVRAPAQVVLNKRPTRHPYIKIQHAPVLGKDMMKTSPFLGVQFSYANFAVSAKKFGVNVCPFHSVICRFSAQFRSNSAMSSRTGFSFGGKVASKSSSIVESRPGILFSNKSLNLESTSIK